MTDHRPPAPGSPPPLPPPLHARLPAVSPVRTGLSGCAIAAIVCAGLAVPVLAILAAIAIPAYHDYTQRAAVSAAMASTMPLQLAIERALGENDRCPGNGDRAIDSILKSGDPRVARISVGSTAAGACVYEIMLHAPRSPALDGKTIRWIRSDGAWACASDLADKLLPPACRRR